MPTDFEWVKKRLDEVYTVNSLQQVRELSQMRLILFSDVHKGQRDGADDFTQCEAIYVAALEHYWQQGLELWLLGDIEELWECRPQRTVAAYRNVLEIEQRFAAARNPRRYVRVVGNHDDLWYDPAAVARHLGPYVAGSEVEEGVRVTVQEAGETLGELFLVHGHQGTLLSDRYRTLSRWLVRIFWRPLQRLLRIKSNTPRNDFEVREEHAPPV